MFRRTASLPRAADDDTEITLPLFLATDATPPPAPVAARGRRVLVIEDNEDTADSLRMLLELKGHTAAVAHTGDAGVEAARRFRPEAVFCDLGLPGGMDGHAVARALRQDPALASAYLVAMTGSGRDEDRRRSLEAGFDVHWTKPVDFADLQQLLVSLPDDPPRRSSFLLS